MTTNNAPRSVLLIGKSQLVLDDSVAGLRGLGYKADATNDSTDVTGRFEVKQIDLVVFGGQVPADRKAELRKEIGAINPRVIFVDGLAGIPGPIVNQVQGAFAAHGQDPTAAPTYTPDERSIRLTLADPANVKVTAWWQASFVPQTQRAIRCCSSTIDSPAATTRSGSPISCRRRPRSQPYRSTRRSTRSASPPRNDREPPRA
jgi:hypothetical protein